MFDGVSEKAELPVQQPQVIPTQPFLLRTGKPHISFSELRNWIDCSFRHKLTYIDKVSEFKTSYHLVFGSAVHEAIEDYLKTREMKPQLAFDYIDKHWHDDFLEPKEKDFSRDKLKDQAREILTEVPVWLEAEFPGWELVGAEQSLYEAIDEKGAKFKGFIDCVIKVKDAKGKETIWILDWKTSGSGWSPMKKRDPLTGLQLILYKNYWLQRTNGTSPESIYNLKNVRCGLFMKNRTNCTWCEFKETPHCP